MNEQLDSSIDRLQAAFQPQNAARIDAIIQYVLTGDLPAEFFGTIRDGTLVVEKGRAKSPKITLTMASADSLKMVAGELPAMSARAAS